ncbi:histidine kinase N-terminal 7TM domain-containing protein [Natronoarchaeum mannanilyticum]|uniref:histidine kinase n=1 Tax=Natronoarchaeum mannanilyticum TaxID=926360 RepID=A0AAV3T6Y9_9EURY
MNVVSSSLPWLTLAAFASGGGALALISYLYRYRGQPGVRWFILAMSAVTVFSTSYGVGLLVFDPLVREAIGTVTWIALAWMGVPFLAFALAYTGRGSTIRSTPFRLLLGVPVLITVLAAANPALGLLWSDFDVVRVFGHAGAEYALEPLAYVTFTMGTLSAGVATLLLFETVFSYGPLYRREAAAVALSAVPPGIAGFVWLFGLGPVPQFNAMAVAFLPHVALDAYAFVGNNMFDSRPATRRAAERTAIDDIDNPIVVLDEGGLVVRLNAAAESLFDSDDADAVGAPVADLIGRSIDLDGTDQAVTIRSDGRRREYAVSTSPLRDSAGTRVGYTLVLQDITVERQREQRLQVLNRTLRHNLRNDLNVVHGYLELAAERIDDEGIESTLETAEETTTELMELGTKARRFEQAVANERQSDRETVVLSDLIEELATEPSLDRHSIDVDVPRSLALESDERLLRIVLRNLLESCLEYADEAPTFEIRTSGHPSSEFSHVEVRMLGAAIPDHEIAVVEDGQETALNHGSGMGLWFVKWGVSTLGGDVTFETDESESTITLQLPRADEGADRASVDAASRDGDLPDAEHAD